MIAALDWEIKQAYAVNAFLNSDMDLETPVFVTRTTQNGPDQIRTMMIRPKTDSGKDIGRSVLNLASLFPEQRNPPALVVSGVCGCISCLSRVCVMPSSSSVTLLE